MISRTIDGLSMILVIGVALLKMPDATFKTLCHKDILAIFLTILAILWAFHDPLVSLDITVIALICIMRSNMLALHPKHGYPA